MKTIIAIWLLAACAIGGDTAMVGPIMHDDPPPSIVPSGEIKFTEMRPMNFYLASAGKQLLTIHPDGSVEADSAIFASEAGRVFVESIRESLRRIFPCADTGRKP